MLFVVLNYESGALSEVEMFAPATTCISLFTLHFSFFAFYCFIIFEEGFIHLPHPPRRKFFTGQF